MPEECITRSPRIAIVGVGPRGLTVFERLCANRDTIAAAHRLTIVLIDTTCVGTGTVWRRHQPGHLLMSTVASHVTVFTDRSVGMVGPVTPGPSLYEWASYLTKIAPSSDLSDQTLAEARDMTPDSYPTRTFYGEYLRWAYEHIAARYADAVEVLEITGTVSKLDEDEHKRQHLTLNDNLTIDSLDAVVLTQGHLGLASQPDPDVRALDAFAAHHNLRYIAPGAAADTGLDVIPAGQPVIVRGLGMTFFDYMTLLTVGRGGSFVPHNGHLKYVPSGREPILHAGSRRGIPYRSRGQNQKGPGNRHTPVVLTPDRVAELHRRAAEPDGLTFATQVWPLIAREIEVAYYSLLIADRASPRDVRRFQHLFNDTEPGSIAESDVLSIFNIESHLRWNWDYILNPARGLRFRDVISFHQWLVGHLHQDIRHAEQGNVHGAVAASLDVMCDLSDEVRSIVDSVNGDSYQDSVKRWFAPLSSFLSHGPPAHRIEQLSALIRAGIVVVTGPQTTITTDQEAGLFTARSEVVPGTEVSAATLIDARMPEPDVRRTSDKLLRELIDTGNARSHRLEDPSGALYETGCLDVEASTHRIVTQDGVPHPRRFALGIPTEPVQGFTAAGPRPNVNSAVLADADTVARAVLTCVNEMLGTVRSER